MFQNSSLSETRYRKFIECIIDSEMVWCLQSSEGFATAPSNEFDEVKVIPFWSDKSYARRLSKMEWESYDPVSISLPDFMENWLIGMHADGILVGTNWDANLFGKEVEPLGLAVEIANALIKKRKGIILINYQDVHHYIRQITEASN